jgi:hypothetical protein
MNMRRDFLFLNCQEAHDWEFVGAKPCCCERGDGCSIPVFQCRICRDYDYGDNEERREIEYNCAAEHYPESPK